MLDRFTRTRMLLGENAMDRLANARVAVFGIGGVGGYVCEALVRSGIGHFDLIDHDTVGQSNLNRQIIALESTVGRLKVEVMKERMLEINPAVEVRTYPVFVLPETMSTFPFEEYDYIVDAIDTVTAKLALIVKAEELNIPIICAMGTGNKLDPSRLRISDISKTTTCPLARIMRKELRARGVKKLNVVWSDEDPISVTIPGEAEPTAGEVELPSQGRRSVPGSTAFVPGTAGLMIASKVIRDLTGR